MEEETKDTLNKEKKEKTMEILCKAKEKVEEAIESVIESGIEESNLDSLGKLIDIHKDIANEKYWKNKEEMNMYGNYGNYNDGGSYGRRGVRGTGPYSRYRDGGSSYGRRGVPGTGRGRYRGEEMLEEMYDKYQDYHDGRDSYNASGNYGAKDESIESLDRMLKSITEFMKCLDEDADSQEEKQLIQKYARKISEM